MAADLRFMREIGAFEPAVRAARAEGIPPAIVLAIASRESRGGRIIAGRGWRGDQGHGHSIWQVDDRSWPGFTRRVDPSDHMRYANFAASLLRDLKDKLGSWTRAVAAYNAGAGGVRQVLEQGLIPDAATTGGNYGRDVSRRARWIRDLHPELGTGHRPIPLKGALAVAGIGFALLVGYRYLER
jgi:hypothetical protein